MTVKFKGRAGFVSNSSSASFLVGGNHFRDTLELAARMMEIRGWRNDEALTRKMYSLHQKSEMKPNPPIFFHTCNYDTYIVPIRRPHIYMVTTCNNHDWWNQLPYGLTEGVHGTSHNHWPEELLDMGYATTEDLEKIRTAFWFWDPARDIWLRDVPYQMYTNRTVKRCQKQGHWDLVIVKSIDEKTPICWDCYIQENDRRAITVNAIYKKNLQERLKNRKKLFNLRI